MDRVGGICGLLEGEYGRPECDFAHPPLDELVLTILSQTTAAVNYNRAFAGLRERFPGWDDLLAADTADVEDAIRVGGLAHVKAERIKRILGEIRARYGSLSLDFLAGIPTMEARDLLMRFEGVGIKTASCVLMFSLNAPVFPVDTHIHRISKLLGLIEPSVPAEAAHGVLQGMIPDNMVYSLHVNLVTHGRRVCKARRPACDDCVLLSECPAGQRILASGAVE